MSVKRNVVDLYPGRKSRPQSIYDRLEAAREKRAKALESRDVANSSAPVRDVISRMTREDSPPIEDKPIEPPVQAAPLPPDVLASDAADSVPYARDDLVQATPRQRPTLLLAITVVALLGLMVLLFTPSSGVVSGPVGLTEAPVRSDAQLEAVFPETAVAFADGAVGVQLVADKLVMPNLPSRLVLDTSAPDALVPDVPDLPVPVSLTSIAVSDPPVGGDLDFSPVAFTAVNVPGPRTLDLQTEPGELPIVGAAPIPFAAPSPVARPDVDDPLGAALAEALAVLDGEDMAFPADVPGFAGITVVLHAPSGLEAGPVDTAFARIEDLGVPSVKVRQTGFRISQSNVRYFHAEDAEAAASVAEAMEATLRDFTSFSPSPAEGLIEVWMSGAPLAASQQQATVVRTRQRAAVTRRANSTSTSRDGGVTLGVVLRDVATTIESGAKKTVETVTGGVSTGVKTVSSGLDKLRGKRKGQKK